LCQGRNVAIDLVERGSSCSCQSSYVAVYLIKSGSNMIRKLVDLCSVGVHFISKLVEVVGSLDKGMSSD
jgi:hypothetical protein